MSADAVRPPGRIRELGRFLEIQNLGLNLPFALAFLLAASNGWPSWRTLLLILVAFIAARNAGHSFNRWADRDLDAKNPRTRSRALVTGRASPTFAIAFALASVALLAACAATPVAIALVFGYSYTKRVTSFTTVFLGIVEAVTPAAVFIAVQGRLPVAALVASAALVLWGTAFETIHSLGDVEADRTAGTYSLPVRLGVHRSSRLVPVFHAGALALFATFGLLMPLPPVFLVAVGVMAGLTATIDARFLQAPTEPRKPFRAHFALGAVFLLGVILSLFASGLP
ncbi:MAG: 4-hydroxybenzoate octaprenyltransferase [Thermoplasmata archaeon]|nr:4-hydroxybenzoate octaprenyltransferase [Thermoplasmata archaeon]